MTIVPVLLITFNRPEHTRSVLEAIIASGTPDIYVFQDGMREDNDTDRLNCPRVRKVIEEMMSSSTAKLHTLYPENNLGCGPGPAAAISWFFENVEQGIVMEDDCLPHPDFFAYCEVLLERYKDNPEVQFINSTLYNGNHENWKIDKSYGFSRYMVTGAWAAWRRSWTGFDLDLTTLKAKKLRRGLKKLLHNDAEANWWYGKVLEIQNDTEKKSYWDYQMQIHLFLNKACTIHPQRNLVSNIGFDAEGTHTLCNDDGRGNQEVFPILPLKHPTVIQVDKTMDAVSFAKAMPGKWWREQVHYLYVTLLYSKGLSRKLLGVYKRLKNGK